MPASVVKSLADKANVSSKKADEAFQKAKKIRAEDTGKSEDDFTDKDWKIVYGIAANILGIKESFKHYMNNNTKTLTEKKKLFDLPEELIDDLMNKSQANKTDVKNAWKSSIKQVKKEFPNLDPDSVVDQPEFLGLVILTTKNQLGIDESLSFKSFYELNQ